MKKQTTNPKALQIGNVRLITEPDEDWNALQIIGGVQKPDAKDLAKPTSDSGKDQPKNGK